QRVTSRIVLDGSRAGWQPDKIEADLLMVDRVDEARIADLEKCTAELEKRLAEARARVHSWRESPEGASAVEQKKAATPRRQTLSSREIASLNEVGKLLVSTA